MHNKKTKQTTHKNILIVCTSPELGGLELYAEREWRFLTQHHQHTCHFAMTENGKLARRLDDEDGVKLMHIQSSKLFPLLAARVMANYIDRNDIHVIHMHWGNDLHLCALAKMLSKNKPTLIYSRHMRITRPKKDPFHRFFYRQVDAVLAVSHCVQDDARLFLPLTASQIKLLHPGVAAPQAATAECQSSLPGYQQDEAFNIGMFGRIEHGKGQHLLVDAVATLLSEGINVRAFIIGHPMDETYLTTLKMKTAAEGLSSNLLFMNFIDNPSRILPCFDVITLLTYCETFGLILAEAMRANTCVIGTNAGGVPDIIDHEENGLLIEPGNSDMLVNAIKRLHAEPEFKRRLAAAGKIKADEKFNEEIHFSKLSDIIAHQNQHYS